MKARDYFERIYIMERERWRLEGEYEQIMNDLGPSTSRVGGAVSRGTTAGASDRIPLLVERRQEAARRLEDAMRGIDEAEDEARGIIKQVELRSYHKTALARDVLCFRYIYGLSAKEAAAKSGYSQRASYDALEDAFAYLDRNGLIPDE